MCCGSMNKEAPELYYLSRYTCMSQVQTATLPPYFLKLVIKSDTCNRIMIHVKTRRKSLDIDAHSACNRRSVYKAMKPSKACSVENLTSS